MTHRTATTPVVTPIPAASALADADLAHRAPAALGLRAAVTVATARLFAAGISGAQQLLLVAADRLAATDPDGTVTRGALSVHLTAASYLVHGARELEAELDDVAAALRAVPLFPAGTTRGQLAERLRTIVGQLQTLEAVAL